MAIREIIFRGKRVDNGEWVEGYYAYKEFDNKHVILVERAETMRHASYFVEVEVEPLTVGQYTGLKDKNGTMIFEGDIVKIIDSTVEDNIFTIQWSDGKEFCIGFGLFSCFEYEVIGNIHEVSK